MLVAFVSFIPLYLFDARIVLWAVVGFRGVFISVAEKRVLLGVNFSISRCKFVSKCFASALA